MDRDNWVRHGLGMKAGALRAREIACCGLKGKKRAGTSFTRRPYLGSEKEPVALFLGVHVGLLSLSQTRQAQSSLL